MAGEQGRGQGQGQGQANRKVPLRLVEVEAWINILRAASQKLWDVGQDQLMGDVLKVVAALEGARDFKEEPKVERGKGDKRMPDEVG